MDGLKQGVTQTTGNGMRPQSFLAAVTPQNAQAAPKIHAREVPMVLQKVAKGSAYVRLLFDTGGKRTIGHADLFH